MVLYSIKGSGVIDQTQYSIPWNPEYDSTHNCNNTHMYLSQVLVEKWNSICLMKKEK